MRYSSIRVFLIKGINKFSLKWKGDMARYDEQRHLKGIVYGYI